MDMGVFFRREGLILERYCLPRRKNDERAVIDSRKEGIDRCLARVSVRVDSVIVEQHSAASAYAWPEPLAARTYCRVDIDVNVYEGVALDRCDTVERARYLARMEGHEREVLKAASYQIERCV